MVQTTVPNIIRPTITADSPDGFFHQVIRNTVELNAVFIAVPIKDIFQFFDKGSLLLYLILVFLLCVKN